MGKHTLALTTILSVYQTKTKISFDSIKLISTLKYIKWLQKTQCVFLGLNSANITVRKTR